MAPALRGGQALLAGWAFPAPHAVGRFCADHPQACGAQGGFVPAADGAEPAAPIAAAAVTPRDLESLAAVNAWVNRAITPRADPAAYGVEDRWALPLGAGDGRRVGDCEDYALEKRRLLLAAGWPPEALYLAIATVPGEGPHAVLVASTQHGDLVLDNLRAAIVPVNQTGYAWRLRQATTDLRQWAIAGPMGAPMLAPAFQPAEAVSVAARPIVTAPLAIAPSLAAPAIDLSSAPLLRALNDAAVPVRATAGILAAVRTGVQAAMPAAAGPVQLAALDAPNA